MFHGVFILLYWLEQHMFRKWNVNFTYYRSRRIVLIFNSLSKGRNYSVLTSMVYFPCVKQESINFYFLPLWKLLLKTCCWNLLYCVIVCRCGRRVTKADGEKSLILDICKTVLKTVSFSIHTYFFNVTHYKHTREKSNFSFEINFLRK